jgi:four helix bundle protein
MRDHRKLEAFQIADELVVEVYSATKEFPDDERFGLTSQMRRSAVSIPTNIVEGSARPSMKDYVRFLGIAFASARELGYLIDLASRLDVLNEDRARKVSTLQGRAAAALNALIRSLSR